MSASPGAMHGTALVTIEFRLPPSALELLYNDTTPWLRVDGEQRTVDGWESCQMSVPPGKHRFEVGVPHREFGTVGRAGRTLKIAAGDEVKLVYQAPSSPGAIGEVLFSEEVSSAQAPWIEVVVGLIIFLGVVYLAYRFLL